MAQANFTSLRWRHCLFYQSLHLFSVSNSWTAPCPRHPLVTGSDIRGAGVSSGPTCCVVRASTATGKHSVKQRLRKRSLHCGSGCSPTSLLSCARVDQGPMLSEGPPSEKAKVGLLVRIREGVIVGHLAQWSPHRTSHPWCVEMLLPSSSVTVGPRGCMNCKNSPIMIDG